MNERVRRKLRDVIADMGQAAIDDPRRCRALLADFCPGAQREIRLLTEAQKAGVADQLARSNGAEPLAMLSGRLVHGLCDELAWREDMARWAVEAWVSVLKPDEPATPAREARCHVSDRQYEQDATTWDTSWEVSHLMGPQTVLIVTGSQPIAEVLDRPVAVALRDEIDSLGEVPSCRRAVIISDSWWYHDPGLRSNPTITVGWSALRRELEPRGQQPWGEGMHAAFVLDAGPWVALGGDTAALTRQVVERFVWETQGLERFLGSVW